MNTSSKKRRAHAPSYLAIAAVCAATLVACGDDPAIGVPGGGGGGGATTSTLCEGLTGGEAILWDLYNGVIRTDPGLPPPIPSPNGAFGHPVYPALGFFYPAGWTPESLGASIHDFGVNVLRDDQTAIWRYYTRTANGAPSPQAVRDTELAALQEFFGLNGENATVVCLREDIVDAGGGIPVAFSNVLLRVGDQTVVAVVSVTSFASVGTSSVHRQIVSAPTAEFSARAMDTFLAIDFQMLRGEDANLFDRDGDGWRDGVDEAPDDPTRH